MDECRRYFKDRLRERGLRVTPERLEILAQAFRLEGHFDARRLGLALRRSGSRISRATIYRTLPHLVETGLLRRYEMGGSRALYEPDFGRTHHEHLVCLECGEILEFVQQEIERLQDEVCRRFGFRAISHSLQIHGICERCQGGDRERVAGSEGGAMAASA